MIICNVLKTMNIGDNTAVIVDGPRELFRNGIGILDENGKPFEVLSVGINCVDDLEALLDKTSLLINGNFISEKMYI